MNTTKLWSILDEGKKLVHWCGIESHKEWNLSLNQVCVQLEDEKYAVFTPDDNYNSNIPIPAFYRLRLVRIINGRYATFNCGLPSRMKYPCCHIMRVFGKLSTQMYSIR